MTDNRQGDALKGASLRDLGVCENCNTLRDEVKRLTRERNEFYFLLLDIVADIEADPKGYDWPNLGRAQAALAEAVGDDDV